MEGDRRTKTTQYDGWKRTRPRAKVPSLPLLLPSRMLVHAKGDDARRRLLLHPAKHGCNHVHPSSTLAPRVRRTRRRPTLNPVRARDASTSSCRRLPLSRRTCRDTCTMAMGRSHVRRTCLASATSPAKAKKRSAKKAKEAPAPGLYQQTVKRSITRQGVGLHSGTSAVVRIRPAPAGQGRYFVRVPAGASHHATRTKN